MPPTPRQKSERKSRKDSLMQPAAHRHPSSSCSLYPDSHAKTPLHNGRRDELSAPDSARVWPTAAGSSGAAFPSHRSRPLPSRLATARQIRSRTASKRGTSEKSAVSRRPAPSLSRCTFTFNFPSNPFKRRREGKESFSRRGQ